jgi:hypothetical protein
MRLTLASSAASEKLTNGRSTPGSAVDVTVNGTSRCILRGSCYVE